VSVALGIQYAKRMRHTRSSVACPAVQYFSIISHKRTIFGGKLLNMKCVFGFRLRRLSETSIIV